LMPVIAFEQRGIAPVAPPLAAQPPLRARAAPTAARTPLAADHAQITSLGTGKRISGVGTLDSVPFFLDAGAYHIEWTARTSATDPANFAAFVKPIDPTAPGWMFVANTIVRPGLDQSGTMETTGTQNGAYYLSAIGASTWTVTLTLSSTRPTVPIGLAAPTSLPFASPTSLPLAELPPVVAPQSGVTAVRTPGSPVIRTPVVRPPRPTPRPSPTPRP
jgi:hypothetical protein